nr:family 43 glycosylhydrolase [Membranihabitans maritimus]
MSKIFLTIAVVMLIVGRSMGQTALQSGGTWQGETFTNPVFEPILADPTVIKDPKSGLFYVYGTQDDWGDGMGSRLIPVLKSENLVDWEVVGEAFETKPAWKERGGLWAPDANYINGKYYLYYAYSVWGDANPGIGVAVATNPDGPFTDKGKIFTSEESGVPNSIDPFYWEENGRKYLFWGSYSSAPSQGTYGVPMAGDGLSVLDLSRKFKIAAGDFEGVMIHKRKGYYYFFGSKGNCCEGARTKYHVMVARSESLKGPYLDREGNPIAERGNGTLFIEGNYVFVGPGHNARLITDDMDMDWFVYHGIDKNQGKVRSGATRRMLMLDPVVWKDGWPEIRGNTPGTSSQSAPVFEGSKR